MSIPPSRRTDIVVSSLHRNLKEVFVKLKESRTDLFAFHRGKKKEKEVRENICGATNEL